MIALIRKRRIKRNILKKDLPDPYTVKYINLMFLQNAKRERKSSTGEVTEYLLHGMTWNQMKHYVLNLSEENISYIQKIMDNFPEEGDIYQQSAYYFRAFSRGQIFLDANHRTGYFSLANILKKNGVKINADIYEIIGLTEYIKAKGWLKQTIMNVNLLEKDEEYYVLVKWFEDKLELR